jgi:hypothetical protein
MRKVKIVRMIKRNDNLYYIGFAYISLLPAVISLLASIAETPMVCNPARPW